MSFKALLEIGKQKWDVISCGFELHRDVDLKGRPASVVYGGTIALVVESTDNDFIIETMVNSQYRVIDGKVTYKKTDEDAKMKELSFERGYVIKYAENFDTDGKNPMAISFTLSCKKLKVGMAEHINDWPGVK